MQKQRLLNIVLLLVVFCSVICILFYSVVSLTTKPRPTYTNNTQATELPTPTLILLQLDKKNENIEITSASLLSGDNAPLTVNDNPAYYLDQIYNNETVDTAALDFSLPEGLASDSIPSTVIVLPYYVGADLQIRDTLTGESYALDKTLVTQALTSPPPPAPQFEIEDVDESAPSTQVLGYTSSPRDGYLDLVFISSNFQHKVQFDSIISILTESLFKHEPFNKYRSKIRIKKIFTTANMKCDYRVLPTTKKTSIYCDPATTYQLLSHTTWDVGIVLDNSKKWGGVTFYNQISNIGIFDNFEAVFVHEMGHAVGKLSDEYLYKTTPSAAQLQNLGFNCDIHPGCPKWKNVPGLGATQCIPGCTYPQAFRSTQDSMMNSYKGKPQEYNEVSKHGITASLEVYTTLPPPPAPPKLENECFQTNLENGPTLFAPFIKTTFPRSANIKQIQLSTSKDFKTFWQLDTSKAREILGSDPNSELITVYAPRDFFSSTNKRLLLLQDNTTYYVKMWDGVGTSQTASIKTNICDNYADINLDGKIDELDLTAFRKDFGKTGEPGFNRADQNRNGIIDIYDYNLLLPNF